MNTPGNPCKIVAAPSSRRSRSKQNEMLHVGATIIVALHRGKFYTPVRAIFSASSGRSETLHCDFWAANDKMVLHGTAKAGGYGYHKVSQALEDATIDAGLRFEKPFGGAGCSRMEEAMLSVAKMLGFRKCHVVAI